MGKPTKWLSAAVQAIVTRRNNERLWEMFLARMSSPIQSEEEARTMASAIQEVLDVLTDADTPEVFSTEDNSETAQALAIMEAAGLRPVRIIT